MPWVPTRQWVVSVPIPLRYWMASSRDLTAQVHTIIRPRTVKIFKLTSSSEVTLNWQSARL